MRRRGLAAVALTTSACMAVTGLGDYEVVDDGVTDAASDGAVVTGVDRAVPPGDATAPPGDGEGGTSREDQAAPPVDAGDGGQDANDGGRSGVRCTSSLACSGGLSDVCCLSPSAALSCTSFFLCAIVTNVRLYACDEDQDCSGAGTASKCCAIMSGSTANGTVCRAACQASEEHVCVDEADCNPSETCTSASPDGTLLPLLRVCR